MHLQDCEKVALKIGSHFLRQPKRLFAGFALLCLAVTPGIGMENKVANASQNGGLHDLDFNLGNWNTHIRVLQHSDSAPAKWLQYEGTAKVMSIWEGRAQVEEIEAAGATGERLEAMVLFIYSPASHQWSKYFTGRGEGQLDRPMVGSFEHGRGEFAGQDSLGGRVVLTRAIWTHENIESQNFEESFSNDGGKNWAPYFAATIDRLQSDPPK